MLHNQAGDWIPILILVDLAGSNAILMVKNPALPETDVYLCEEMHRRKGCIVPTTSPTKGAMAP